jgi:ABC-type molybdate transport system substrate-binding protein
MGKPVAKLKVMCARSMQEVVTALAFDFTSQTGHEVELRFGTVGALQKRLDAGESADVMISGVPAIDRLEASGALAAGSRKNVATVHIGVAVREGASAPISPPRTPSNRRSSTRAGLLSATPRSGARPAFISRVYSSSLGWAT